MGAKPSWIGYVGVDDVDATADRITRLGGAVHVPPTDVSDISRFSIFTDPQTARLALLKWLKPGQEQPADPGAPGRVGWHELLAADWEQAWAFYGELLAGKRRTPRSERRAHISSSPPEGRCIGGMVTKPATMPVPFWLYYFNVGDIDARRSASRPVAARSWTVRLKCRAAAGSSDARTLRVPYSRWRERGAATLSDISSASHRAILPAREAGDGLGKRQGTATAHRRRSSPQRFICRPFSHARRPDSQSEAPGCARPSAN